MVAIFPSSTQEIIAEAATYTRVLLAALDESEQQTLHQLLLKVSHSLGFVW